MEANISIPLSWLDLRGEVFCPRFTSAWSKRTWRPRREEMPGGTKEIPVICPARHFRVVGTSTTTPILSPRNVDIAGVVGRRKMAAPRGRRSTDCNVARNYVSAVSTADIPPSRLFSMLCRSPLFPHASLCATAAAGIRGQHARDAWKKGHLSFSVFFRSLDRNSTIRWTILVRLIPQILQILHIFARLQCACNQI